MEQAKRRNLRLHQISCQLVRVYDGRRHLLTFRPPNNGGAAELERIAEAEGGLEALVRKVLRHAEAHRHGVN